MSAIQPNFSTASGLKPIVDSNGNPLHDLNVTTDDSTMQNKLKLMYVYDALLTLTDSDHIEDEQNPAANGVTLPEITKYIADNYNVTIDRKCFYQIISALEASGIDVVHSKGHYAKYYINERLFSLAELKLIADAISSCKVLDESSAKLLIDKLKRLTSRRNAAEITNRVYTAGRPSPSFSAELYSTIDTINTAIRDGKMVRFEYYYYTVSGIGDKRKCRLRKSKDGGSYRFATPYELVWDNERYYMLCHLAEHDKKETDDSGKEVLLREMTHFRVDRMRKVSIISPDERHPFVPIEDVEPEFDLRSYMSTTFSMFGGRDTLVKIRFHESDSGKGSIISSVVDQFGSNVRTIPEDDEHFYIKVPVKVNNPFFAWVMQFGGDAEIVEPLDVRQQYAELLRKTLASLEQSEK